MTRARLLGVVAAVVVVAVVAAGVVAGVVHLASGGGAGRRQDHRSAVSGSTALPTVPASTSAAPELHTQTVYYLGAGPRGPVLFPHSALVVPGTSRLDQAVAALEETPDLHQYRTVWQAGWIGRVSTRGHVLDVDVDAAPAARPGSVDPSTATASIQQLVYTLQAATGTRRRVAFLRHGKPAATVLGVPTARPVSPANPALTLSRVTISEPDPAGIQEGRRPLDVRGLASTAHGALVVRLERGGTVLRTVPTHTHGYGGAGGFYLWRVHIPVHGLPSGTYTVVASGPDPTDPSLTVTASTPARLGHP